MSFFLLMNTKEDILKNDWNQTPKFQSFFKISYEQTYTNNLLLQKLSFIKLFTFVFTDLIMFFSDQYKCFTHSTLFKTILFHTFKMSQKISVKNASVHQTYGTDRP